MAKRENHAHDSELRASKESACNAFQDALRSAGKRINGTEGFGMSEIAVCGIELKKLPSGLYELSWQEWIGKGKEPWKDGRAPDRQVSLFWTKAKLVKAANSKSTIPALREFISGELRSGEVIKS